MKNIKMKIGITAILLIISSYVSAQWSATGALATSGAPYLIAAANIGDTIYAVGANNTFVRSIDQGVNWSAPSITAPNGVFATLTGTGDRLYASMKINTYDYELHYSLDNGATWTMDTVGLPANITNTGKPPMSVKYMGNNYVMAYTSQKAYYKQLGAVNWIETTIDVVITDITSLPNKWLAIGINKILESTNNGISWSPITTSGLPTNFQGNIITSNNVDRLFMSNAPAAGAEDIYLSVDGGVNWTLTNSAGLYSHANPWVQSLFAVNDYIFASIKPEFANIQDAPPFNISSTQSPSFSVGDVSGLPTGQTNTHLPFFFNSGNKLFTLFWDVYVSQPGFSGTTSISKLDESVSFDIFPNPVNDKLIIETSNYQNSSIEIVNIEGQLLKKIPLLNSTTNINVDYLNAGIYFLVFKTKERVSIQKMIKK